MRQIITAFVAMICLLLYFTDAGRAQLPGQIPGTFAVGFGNNSPYGVIVKGYTIVNQTKKPGQLLLMQKGGKAYEDQVPFGIRYYTVFDAVTNRVLLFDQPVPVQGNTFLFIRQSPLDPTKVIITK